MKIKLKLENAPEGIGADQLFDNNKSFLNALDQWEESGKMRKVVAKGSAMTFETTIEGQTVKGKGMIQEVGDDFEFPTEE